MKPEIRIEESTVGLVHRSWPADRVAPVKIQAIGAGRVEISAEDVRTGRVVWKTSVDLSPNAPLPLEVPVGFGVYRLTAKGQAEGTRSESWLGVIPPFHPGVRPDSFFASNTSNLRQGRDLDLLEAIGMKVQRVHFQNVTRAQFEEQQRRHTWLLPIIGYADPIPKTEQAQRLKQHGPPADFDAFVAYWRGKLQAFPEIQTWEFWNEPWIYGWTWADTPDAYRRLQTQWCRMARELRPKLRIVAGSSWMFVQDHLEVHPEAWRGLLDGTTHHPYSDISAPTFRGGAMQRNMDGGFLTNRRMGLPYYYLTESGTNIGAPDHGGANPQFPSPNNAINARKIVHLYVLAALNGAFQGNAQWGIGYGHGWTQSNASFAMLTHLLEDRPIVADLWPRQALLRGAIFAHPRHVTDRVRALPRAEEIATRWEVPVPAERQADPVKVAVIWSWTGPARDQIDKQGTLTLDDAADIRAFDLYGRPIPRPADNRLQVPFTEDPVYLLTEQLDVAEFHQRLAGARIDNLTPVNLYVQPLAQAAAQPQTLLVRLDNQMNEAVAGELTVVSPGLPPMRASWRAEGGALVDIPVAWPGGAPAADNRYAIAVETTVQTAAGRKLSVVRHSQIIPVAQIARRTMQVDGKSDDWQGVPVVRISGRSQVDFTRYLLNPNLPPPKVDPAGAAEQVFEVRAAYDDDYLYFAISGLGLRTRIGQPHFEGLPWKKGMPDGLQFAQYEGVTAQIALGFRDRVPGYGRQMNDPWAWKGQFYDTDYLYLVHPTVDQGDMVVRQWGPDTDRRTAYQTDPIPHVAPVPGARVVLRDGFWELAIPRKEVALFDPAAASLRLGILLDGRFNLAETGGVFDYWNTSGSFTPAWEFRLPAQVRWGIEK